MADLKNAQRVFASTIRRSSSSSWNAVQEADCVRILMPGDTYLEIDELATDGHPLPYNERFADKWDMYQTARSQTEGQTDIGAVAWMDEASRQALRAAHVNTVEQLATIGDDQVSRIGFGFVRFRDKARAEVDTRQKAAEYEPMQAELAAMAACRADGHEGAACGADGSAEAWRPTVPTSQGWRHDALE